MKYLDFVAVLVVGLTSGAGSQVAPLVDGQARISVNVNLVVLHPTVRDRTGAFVSDLRQQDFEVYESGVRQPIHLFRHDDVPVTVGLVVDHSGSMRLKIHDVLAAARTFVEASNPGDEMFVINFNEHVTPGLTGDKPVSNRPDELVNAIANSPTTGRTALYDAVAAALRQLQSGTREKKVLIIISDGGDNASAIRMDEVMKMAAQSNALLYTIGIFDDDDPDKNPKVLNRMARETGGEAFFPRELKDAVSICKSIARDIRNQYTLGYISNNQTQRPGFRPIRVVARPAQKEKLSVRVRSGYVAEPAK